MIVSLSMAVGRRRWRTAALALLLALTGQSLRAEPASEAAVKAGFVFNFIKFTQWPDGRDGASAQIRLCAPSDQPLEGQLLLLDGRSAGGRVIEVRTGLAGGDWRQCDVLFLGEADAQRLPTLQQRLGHAPVLTLGDVPGFVEAGGMIGLRVESSRVRFDVNLSRARKAGLMLNSQMIRLAGKVLQ
jgi:hypothetical protein